MQSERDLNKILTSSLDVGYKIQDVGDGVGNKRPFDLFGTFNDRPVYVEGKFKPVPEAFNWSRLEDHQIDYLLKFDIPNAIACVIIGVVFKRGDIRCFVYCTEEAAYRKKNNISVTKKEFMNDENYVKVEKGKVDYNKIVELLEKKKRERLWEK